MLYGNKTRVLSVMYFCQEHRKNICQYRSTVIVAFYALDTLRPLLNNLLLPWSFKFMTCMLGGWSAPFHPPHPWWPLLPPHLPCPLPWHQLLVLNSPMVSWPRMVAVSPSLSLLIVDDGSISVSVVVTFLSKQYWTHTIILVPCGT